MHKRRNKERKRETVTSKRDYADIEKEKKRINRTNMYIAV